MNSDFTGSITHVTCIAQEIIESVGCGRERGGQGLR